MKCRYIIEIFISVFLIFVSYFVWDRIDVMAYEEYITGFNIENVMIEVENGFDTLAYLSDNDTIKETKVFLNNYQDKDYSVNLLLNLTGINEDILSNLYLSVDGKIVYLKDMCVKTDVDNYSFLVANVNLEEYEKMNILLKLLVDDDYIFSNNSGFSYSFQEEIL